MTVALILLGALLGVGALLYAHHRLTESSENSENSENSEGSEGPEGSECCGMHITCEKDSLLSAVSDTIEYFDDEELDLFQGREADSYTDEEADRFRDVLLTTRPEEIAAWARSLQLRGITLPTAVRDELLLIVAERRATKTSRNQ